MCLNVKNKFLCCNQLTFRRHFAVAFCTVKGKLLPRRFVFSFSNQSIVFAPTLWRRGLVGLFFATLGINDQW